MPGVQALAAAIASLNAWAPALLTGLERGCVQGGLFAAAIWVICRAFRRFPAALRSVLWWLACAKLLTAVLCAGFVPLPIRTPMSVPLPVVHPLAALTAPVGAPRPAAEPRRDIAAPSRFTASEYVGMGNAIPKREVVPALPALSLSAWLALIYGIGVLVVAGRLTCGAARLRRATRGAALAENPATREAAREVAARLRLGSVPRLVESAAVASPLVVGALRPVIVLPRGFAATVTPEGLRLALAHEMAHVRRGDLLLGAVPLATRMLLFFFPPVALVCRECEQVREEACDALAVAVCGAPAARYGRLLLSLAEGTPAPAALGMAAADFARLKRRLSALRRGERPLGRRARGVATLLVAGAITGAFPWRLAARAETSPGAPELALRRYGQPRYSVTDIGTLGGASSDGFGVSDTGTVVGSANMHPNYGRGHAFVADGNSGGSLVDLTADSVYERSVAVAVNARGLVAATAYNRPARPQAFVWDGKRHYLGSLPGFRFSQAASINDAGMVAGTVQKGRVDFGAIPARAFLYQNGRIQDLGTLGGPYSMASAVSATGMVVGKADLPRGRDESGPTHAFAYQRGSGMRDLGTLPGGKNSRAHGVNAASEVVGFSETEDGASRAFLVTSGGPMQDLGTLPGRSGSVAYAISDRGAAVGAATGGEIEADPRAVLWRRSPGEPGGRSVDLNDCIAPGSGWTLETARAINGRGWIVGQGRRNGQRRAFLLKPL